MKSGLRMWDENGKLIFDTSVNTTEYLGSFDTTAENGSKIVSLTAGRRLWVSLEQKQISTSTSYFVYPRIEVDGNVIKWIYDSNVSASSRALYSVHYGSY